MEKLERKPLDHVPKLHMVLRIALAAVLILGLLPQLAAPKQAHAADTAYLEVGSRIDYEGAYTTYMYVDGSPAYCATPHLYTPPSGTYTKEPVNMKMFVANNGWTARQLASLIWFGWGGPGFDGRPYPSTWYDGTPMNAGRYIALSHIIMADMFCSNADYALDGVNDSFYNWARNNVTRYRTDGSQNPNSLQDAFVNRSGEVPQEFIDRMFMMTDTGYVAGDPTSNQVIISYTWGGWIDLQKASGNTDITDNHPCYSLEGAVYGIYEDAACTREVATITTDANGYAKSDFLGTATYYVKEKTAPKGYALDTNAYQVKVDSNQTVRVNGEKVYDMPQNDPVNMFVGKIDLETTLNMPQGSASLAGAEFTVRYYNDLYDTVAAAQASGAPTRTWVVRTDEDGFATLMDGYKIAGDDYYRNSGGTPTVPIGTLLIQETKAPKGYFLTDSSVYLRKVESAGSIMENVETYDCPIVKEQVYRGDFEFVKAREDTQNRLAYVPFKITSVGTGESHIIVTDANGEAKTASSWNAHTEKTNANDAVVRADGTIDESKLDPYAGIWFYGTADKSKWGSIKVNNAKGAMAYGEYLIEELPCEANKGLTMVSLTVNVERDGYSINLGTIDNQGPGAGANINTVARNKTTGTHTAAADPVTRLVDRVNYQNLQTDGQAYELYATLMDVATGEPVRDASGNPVTGSARFVPTSANGYAEVEIACDTRQYANRDVVFFEELRLAGASAPIAEHKDLADYEQQIRIVGQSLKTKAWDTTDGDKEVSLDTASEITDTVTYRNLVPGEEYALVGSLYVRTIEMTAEGTDIQVEPLLDADGNQVTSMRMFTPEYADGEADVTFTCDTTDLKNRTIVVFECLYKDGEIIAEHTDAYDEEQVVQVTEPTIGTQAADAADGDPIVAADREATLIDTVTHENLMAGHEYTLVGTLMVKTHEVREDGTKVTSATPLLDAAGEPISATTTFTPDSHKGVATVQFTFDASDLDGAELVVFEKLFREGREVTNHEDPADEGQSFIVQAMSISTDLADDRTKGQTLTADSEAALTDTIVYNDAVAGAAYTAYAMLIDPETGLPVLQYSADENADDTATLATLTDHLAHALGVASEGEGEPEGDLPAFYGNLAPYPHGVDIKLAAELIEQAPELAERLCIAKEQFTADGGYGLLKMRYKIDARGLEGTKATSVALIVRDEPYEAVAGEIDLECADQTVEFVAPEIGTYATDKTDGDKNLITSAEACVADEVRYEGLTPGKEYILEGVLYDKQTGKPLVIADKQVTSTKYFVPAAADGTETVEFTFDASGLKGHELVVYEYLYREMETPSGTSERVKVAEHADIDSAEQTVGFDGPTLPKTGQPGESYDKTGDIIAGFLAAIGLLLLASSGAYLYYQIRKKKADEPGAGEEAEQTETTSEE